MEFQAIVLAGGKGSRMNGMTKHTPKCLLPIGNKPMIWYPVRFLEKAGFSEIIIITLNSFVERVEEKLSNCGIHSKLTVVGFRDEYLESDDDFGTASCLSVIRDRIKTDCIIVSCDLITNVNLQEMANLYRVNDASFLMLLYDISEQNGEFKVPGTGSSYQPEIDYIGFDEETNRLLYFNPDGEESNFKLKSTILKKYPSITLTGRVQDAHLYFIKKSLIEYAIDNNKSIHSLKGDFVPSICRKQFSKHKIQQPDNESDDNLKDKKTIFDYITINDLKDSVGQFSANRRSNKDLLSCYYYLQSEGVCFRTNNSAVYLEVNKQAQSKILPSFAKRERTESVGSSSGRSTSTSSNAVAQIGADCIIGDKTTIGDKAVINKSIIGKNCHIGEKAKIINSVIFDSVTIGDGSIINSSIVCYNVKTQKCEIQQSIIEEGMNVDSGKIQNQTYCVVDLFDA